MSEVIIRAHREDFQAERFYPDGNIAWMPADTPQPQAHAPTCWRTCAYCGSMHPEDLLAFIKLGAKVTGSDWKYGWPHKFYVQVPNPAPDMEFIASSHYERGKPESHTYGTRQFLHGKWYNVHLYDENLPVEIWDALAEQTRIRFKLDQKDGKPCLRYGAPYGGYQRTGMPEYDDPLPPIPDFQGVQS